MCECITGADEARDPHAERPPDKTPRCNGEFEGVWTVECFVKPRLSVIARIAGAKENKHGYRRSHEKQEKADQHLAPEKIRDI
jgi:hypothetical protein